jgi:hypothetical protein
MKNTPDKLKTPRNENGDAIQTRLIRTEKGKINELLKDPAGNRASTLVPRIGSLSDHRLCGVDRVTIYRWKEKGKEYPESRHGEFLEAIELAELESKRDLMNKVRTCDDFRAWKWLLCNRWPEFKDHFSAEISGPHGDAIPVALNPFNVVIKMAANDGPEPEFHVVDHRPAEQQARDNGSGSVPLPTYENRISPPK